MAEDKDLDKVIAKRKELAELLQREGNLSAQRAKAISEQYNTLEEISNITKTINQNGESFVKELNKAVDAGTGLYDVSLGLVESLKESLGIQSRRNEFDRDLFKINKDITNTLRDQKENLYTKNDVSKQIAQNDEKRLAALKVSKSLVAGMSEESLKEVQKAQDVKLARLDIEKAIKAELAAVAAGAPYDAEKLARLEASAKSLDNSFETQLKMLSPMQQQLLYTNMNIAGLDEANAKQKERLERINEINKATGLTGELIKGFGKLPGLGTIFKASDIEDVKKELLDSGKEANKFQIAGNLAKKTFGNLRDTLTDPAFLFTAVTEALVRNSKLTNQFQKELGVSYESAKNMRQEIANTADASGELFINSEKLQKSVFALAENTGVFFDLSSQSAETFTVLTDRMGLAANEAANLTMLARLQGKDTETTMANMAGTANAALATSKTTANVKDILGDVAKSSKGLQASFAANPGALAKAAVAARELGATLKDMEATQSSLLDFEGSISAELEAELLTGKQLNLERARAAALNNDMKTLGEELKKQNVDLASFGKMNVKQQEAMAKALGMNRDTMGEMLLKQETQNMTAEEVRKKFGEQTYEQFKAMDASEKMQEGMAKLKDIFANIMQAFTPIIDGFALLITPISWIGQMLAKLNEWTGGWSSKIIGALVLIKLMGVNMGGLFSKFKGFFGGGLKGITNGLGGIWERFSGGIKGATGKFTKFIGGIKGGFSGVADKAKGIQFDPRMAGGGRFRDMASGRLVSKEAANAAGVFKPGEGPAAAAKGVAGKASASAEKAGKTAAPKDNGKALKEKMQNIAKGLKAFADPKVLLGGLYMIASAPGLIALGLASLPLKIVEKLNGPKLMASMQGIASGVASFASASAGILPLIGAAGALAILTLGLPGLAGMALLGAPAAAGLTALTGGLMALGTAAATGVPFLGAALLGAFGVALIPFGAALGLAAPAIEAIGTVIATTIMAIADAVVTVMPALTKGLIDLATQIPIANLLALAFSLPSLAFGVGLLGGALLLSAPGFIIGSFTLPLIGPALIQLGEALAGIDTAAFFQFGIGMAALTAAFTLAGLAYPLIIGGSLALSIALIPLTAVLQVAAPAMLIFGSALAALSSVDYSNLLQLAIALPALALGIGSLALSMGAAVIAAVSLKIITSALEPLAEIAPKLSLTDETLKNIATSARTLAESLSGINVSPLILLSQIGGKVSNLKDTFASIGEGIASMGSVMKDKLLNAGEGIKNFFGGLKDKITTIGGVMKDKLLNAGEGIKNFFGGLKDKFVAVGEAAKGKFAEIKEKVSSAIKPDATPRPEQAGVSGDMSGVISENVRTAVVDVLRETLPNGEIKVTAVVENLETGDRAEGVTVLPANSPERIQETAEQSAALKAKSNLTSGILSSTKESRAAGLDPNSPTGRQQGATAEEIEGIVASTIKALVPEMVAAISNVKVVNDNFHNSKQSEGPSRNRQITNNNFA